MLTKEMHKIYWKKYLHINIFMLWPNLYAKNVEIWLFVKLLNFWPICDMRHELDKFDILKNVAKFPYHRYRNLADYYIKSKKIMVPSFHINCYMIAFMEIVNCIKLIFLPTPIETH